MSFSVGVCAAWRCYARELYVVGVRRLTSNDPDRSKVAIPRLTTAVGACTVMRRSIPPPVKTARPNMVHLSVCTVSQQLKKQTNGHTTTTATGGLVDICDRRLGTMVLTDCESEATQNAGSFLSRSSGVRIPPNPPVRAKVEGHPDFFINDKRQNVRRTSAQNFLPSSS